MSFTAIRSEEQFEARAEEFLQLEQELKIRTEHGVTFAMWAESRDLFTAKIRLLQEFEQLDAGYELRSRYGVSARMFLDKPWYYRNMTELLEDGARRPPLAKQRVAMLKADAAFLRREGRPRLHHGEIFQPLHHHRHRRGGQMQFTRRWRP